MPRKLTHQELIQRQQEIVQRKGEVTSPLFPFSVVLNNIRSLYNVGSIFRTADGVGVEKLWLCGITGTPESDPPKPSAGFVHSLGRITPSSVAKRERIEKTALGAEKTVPWEHASDILPVIRNLKRSGYQIVLLEQTKESVPYQEFEPKSPVCLVVGNEISGISDELLALSDAAVEIEMAGTKNSLNVTVAFGIVAYYMRNRLIQTVNYTLPSPFMGEG